MPAALVQWQCSSVLLCHVQHGYKDNVCSMIQTIQTFLLYKLMQVHKFTLYVLQLFSCWQPFINENVFEIIDRHRNLKKNMANLVSTVPAVGLAPKGARPSAVTVMTKFEPLKYTGPALQGLRYSALDDRKHAKHRLLHSHSMVALYL